VIALVIAALLQAPTVEDHVAGFLKGDAASRGELLKLGASAIRPLQKARDKNPEKIDALVLDLKRGCVYPADSKIARAFETKVTLREATVRLSEDPESAPIHWEDVRRSLPGPVFLLPFKLKELKSDQAKVAVTDRPARELLDQLFSQTGLDYAYFHNAVVLGPPDKIWGARPAFGPAFATTQEFDPVDAAVLKAFKGDSYPAARLVGVGLSGALDFLLGGGRQHRFTIKPENARDLPIPLVDAEGLGALDMLSMVTQIAGLDFAIAGGDFVIDTREALEKAYPKRK